MIVNLTWFKPEWCIPEACEIRRAGGMEKN
jgi:hypothetical protein